MRKIAVITGTRAEYSYLRPLMKAIENDGDLKLMPLITGMHLLSDFGNTHKLVEKDFLNSSIIPMPLKGDSIKDMADYLSCGIKNFADYFEKSSPDIVTVLGDRTESLAASLAAFYLNIPIAHINGGDVSGTTIDESIRHAITKIAHIHLAHTKSTANRIKKMGEDENLIFITGALTLDVIMNSKLASKNEIFNKYGLNPDKRTFLVVQHPVTTLKDKGYSQMQELLLSLDVFEEQTIRIYPNCDAGGRKLIDLIKQYEKKKYCHVFKNLPHGDYLSFMKSVNVLIGNSSSGIIESPYFKLPVINIGSRQQGRERSDNILDVEPKKESIIKAIDITLHDEEFQRKVNNCVNKFGDGKAALKITKIFKEIKLGRDLIQKQITY